MAMSEDELVALTVQLSRRLVPLEPGTRLRINGEPYMVGNTLIANDLDSPHYAGHLYEIMGRDGKRSGLQVSHLRRSGYASLIQLITYLASYPPDAYDLNGRKTVMIGGQTYWSVFSSTTRYMQSGREGEQRYIMFTDKNDPRYPRLTLVQYGRGNWLLETKRELDATQIQIV